MTLRAIIIVCLLFDPSTRTVSAAIRRAAGIAAELAQALAMERRILPDHAAASVGVHVRVPVQHALQTRCLFTGTTLMVRGPTRPATGPATAPTTGQALLTALRVSTAVFAAAKPTLCNG